ncbi:MAG: ABC transporter permease [Alphaproteobacteria bacterium]|jgi:ABC-type dipeptide/oligopeptide/nickel transport system permease subunit
MAEPARQGRRRNLPLAIGGTLLAAYAAIAVLAPWIAPQDPNAQDLLAVLERPSAEHWLGTDQIGRDLLSRLVVGTRFTLAAALLSVAIAGVVGVTLGLLAGYSGGRVDAAITGLVDLLLTIPNLILAIAVASVIGAGLAGLVIATTASFVPPLARLVRGRVLEIRGEDFIAASIAAGTRRARILRRHVLPNALTVVVIETSLLAGQAVLVGAALGFLGLGVQPPAPEWGTMLGAGREFIEVAPHLVLVPGLAITLLVFAFNMLGDGLRDRLDPKARN